MYQDTLGPLLAYMNELLQTALPVIYAVLALSALGNALLLVGMCRARTHESTRHSVAAVSDGVAGYEEREAA